MGWNIDLTIDDGNGFVALHKKRATQLALVTLRRDIGINVLNAHRRALPHSMPEGFASLSEHNTDMTSDDQPELEQSAMRPLFQRTDSVHDVSDSGDENSMNNNEN